jgi:purine nucleosidase/pyrimidine-specific ribonucleoside hydrolase
MPEHVIIDTDPGIDDALAILLALRSPELQISAITTVSGNVPVAIATRNVFRIMSLVPSAPRIPIAQGAAGPLQKKPVYSTGFHGEDGLGGLDGLRDDAGNPRYPLSPMTLSSRNAVDEILFQLATTPQPLTIIALGPLTNIAAAIQKDEKTMAKAERIVLMGGAVGVPGNVSPVAEFNIYVDPLAAGIVFDAGIPLTVVGLDVTHQVKLTAEDISAATSAHQTPVGRFMLDCTKNLLAATSNRYKEPGFFLHDPLAVGVVIDPSFVAAEAMSVGVETRGDLTEGMTVADRRLIHPSLKKPPNADICLKVDAPGFIAFFLKRLTGWKSKGESDEQ